MNMALKKYNEAISEAQDEEMARDENVLLLGEDIGLFESCFLACQGLYKKYGSERVIDTPISESAIVGAAIGCAVLGLRPVVEIMFIDFTCVCMDQIVNQAAKMRYMLGGQVKVPMVIRTQAGAAGFAAQHSQCLESWFTYIPGIKVVMPATPFDAKGLLKTSIRDDNPVMFIEHQALYFTTGDVPDEEYLIPIGKADIKRKGKDVTLIAHSRMVLTALEAAKQLSSEGIDSEVLDLRSLSPMDENAILSSVAKTGKVVIIDEGHRSGGISALVSAIIAEKGFDCLDKPIQRITALDCPIPFGKEMEKATLPSVEKIVQQTRSMFDD